METLRGYIDLSLAAVVRVVLGVPGTWLSPDRQQAQVASIGGRWAWGYISGIFQQPKELAQELKGLEKASGRQAVG